MNREALLSEFLLGRATLVNSDHEFQTFATEDPRPEDHHGALYHRRVTRYPSYLY
jgi:hypothetical protein